MGLIRFFKDRVKKAPPKKLGLALGSGGAKGFSHLGALKAFEEEGIRFDVVTGTSIGSIVGAMTARGYTSTDMVELIKTICFREYVKFVRLKMDMTFIERMIESYMGDLEFKDLKIPFACWATDEDTNEGGLLNSGAVARACTASSAMPPFFRSVRIGEQNLVDGAFTNAVPADIAREMGADFVIGIDLAANKRYEGNKGGVLSGVLNVIGYAPAVREVSDARTRGYDAADVMLTPNLRDFHATDLSAVLWNAMYEEGYTEAKLRMPEIKAMMRDKGFSFPKTEGRI